jgi:hypothetical protein
MTAPITQRRAIHFKLGYITRDFVFDDTHIMVSDPPKGIDVTLEKRPPDDGSFSIVKGDGVITATCEREVSDRLYYQAASSGQLSVKQESVTEVFNDMQSFILRTLRLVRWRTKAPGRPYPLRATRGFTWSFDGLQWKSVTDYMTLKLRQLDSPPEWTNDAEEFVKMEILGELDEPLGHELLREAWTNRETNLRSAIVLAVAAAEVGFKQFASKLFPDTAWILENLQSPPLTRMLDRFPWNKLKLQINGKDLTVPDSIKDELTKAIKLRNDVVHGGAVKLSVDTVESVLTSVRDLLYFLDALTDVKRWAFDHMSPEARKHYA